MATTWTGSSISVWYYDAQYPEGHRHEEGSPKADGKGGVFGSVHG
jgi:hypothetical protein